LVTKKRSNDTSHVGPKGRDVAKKHRRSYDISPEVFVRTWQLCDSADEVAEVLGMPKPIALARASGYRRNGVLLKYMLRGSSRVLDIGGLNRVIHEVESRPPDATPVKAKEGDKA
jgi:hypothetical protein